MTKRTRRNHTPAFKAKVALAAVKGEKTLAELAQQLALWPAQALIVDRDGQHTLIAPAVALHAIRIAPLAAVAFRHEPHPGHAADPLPPFAMA